MINEIEVSGKTIKYDLQYKNVKNINLRIKNDCTVCISVNKRVPKRTVEKFIESKAYLIFNAFEKYRILSEKPIVCYFSESEIKNIVIKLCNKYYPYFEKSGVKYPEIKFRKMISQWGNCRSKKGILTFSLNLVYAPMECIEYVVVHEFTHFLQPNHSKSFYTELSKIMPDWKEKRKILKLIQIPKK